jgi:hypothetical protein
MQRLGQSDPSLAHAQRWRLFTRSLAVAFSFSSSACGVCLRSSTSTNEGEPCLRCRALILFRAVKTRERKATRVSSVGWARWLLLSSIDLSALETCCRCISMPSFDLDTNPSTERVSVFRLHGHSATQSPHPWLLAHLLPSDSERCRRRSSPRLPVLGLRHDTEAAS